jgi:hypothetical protein
VGTEIVKRNNPKIKKKMIDRVLKREDKERKYIYTVMLSKKFPHKIG